MDNQTLKQWFSHPVMVGTLLGVIMGSVYLAFNAKWAEDDSSVEPMNIAEAESVTEPFAQQRITFHYADTDKGAEPLQAKPATTTVVAQSQHEVPALVKQPPSSAATQTSSAKPASSAKIAQVDKKVTLKALNKPYTLQLLAAKKEDNVRQFISQHHLQDKARVVHTKRGSEDWYVVLYGEYLSRQDAKNAMTSMPTSLKKEGLTPWVRQADEIKAG